MTLARNKLINLALCVVLVIGVAYGFYAMKSPTPVTQAPYTLSGLAASFDKQINDPHSSIPSSENLDNLDLEQLSREEAMHAQSTAENSMDHLFLSDYGLLGVRNSKDKNASKQFVHISLIWKHNSCEAPSKRFLRRHIRSQKRLLISLESLFDDRMQVNQVFEISKDEFLNGFTRKFTIQKSQQDLLFGLFLCSSNDDSYSCLRKKPIDSTQLEFSPQKYTNEYEMASFKNDSIYFFDYGLISNDLLFIFTEPDSAAKNAQIKKLFDSKFLDLKSLKTDSVLFFK